MPSSRLRRLLSFQLRHIVGTRCTANMPGLLLHCLLWQLLPTALDLLTAYGTFPQ